MPRKLKSQDGNPYEAIRGMWEGAYVSQFVRLFQSKFGFARLSVQDLEDALLDNSCVAVADVVARLLRYLTGRKDIVIENFEAYFEEFIQQKKLNQSQNNNTWQELGPEEKLVDLKLLIDHVYQEKEEDLAEYLDDNFSPEDLRGIRVGQDAFNNTYWYLDDLRLYRENSPKKPTKKDWECVCANLAEWQLFIKQFRKTTNIQERELYNYLNDNLLPIIQTQLEELNSGGKQIDNNTFFEREQEDTKEMLEKLNCLNSGVSSGNVVDTNITEILCCENNQNVSNNNGKSRRNSVIKIEEQKMGVNCCAIENSEKSKSDTNSGNATIDIKPAAMSNMCSNACGANCSNNCSNMHEGCNCGSVNCPHTPSASTPNRECGQDGNLPLSDNPSESSFSSNKENAPPSAGGNGLGDLPPVSAMSNMVGSTGSLGSSASVQPLPSNMLSKSAVPVETQYMQQQSQIFVFSTTLANRAAESLVTGQFTSIIAFHCSQPGTKCFLEKHPLKVQQFNRQNHALWLNNLAQSKQSGRQIKPGVINQFGGSALLNHPYPATPGAGPCHGPCTVHNVGCTPHGQPAWTGGNTAGPSDSCNSQQWPQQFSHSNVMHPHHRFHSPDNGGIRPLGPNSVGPPQGNQLFSGGMPFHSTVRSPGMNQSSVGPINNSLTGVKIPDENLTPQQRQHREEQLAMIRKMSQLLFPDQHHDLQQHQMGIHAMMPQTGQLRFPSNEMCSQQTMEGAYPHHSCLSDHDHSQMCLDNGMFSSSGLMVGPQSHQQMPPTSVAAHLEWNKLHQQYMDEKRRKISNTPGTHVSGSPSQPIINSPSPNMGINSSSRISAPPPPPPYHTTPCNTMSSPHPASPNTGSLSLPSPRTTSGLPSPADASRHFSHPTPPGPRVPQPSPGNSAGCNSMQTTPLNSPKPSVTPSGPPSTGNPVMVRTPTTPSNPNTTPASTPSSILPSPSPGTPISSCGIANRKQGVVDGQDSSNDFTPISQPSSTSSSNTGDGMFGRHLPCNQTQANQKPMSDCTNTQVSLSHKEPSLMPVPSPQQIQYLSTFEGQELTIQKQPNTSLTDLDLVSPTMITNGTMDMSPASHPQPFPTPDSSQGSFSNLNGSFSSNLDGGTPDNLQSHFSNTNQINSGDGGQRHFSLPSPQMAAGFENNQRLVVPVSQAMEGPIPRFSSSHSQTFNSVPTRMLVPNQPSLPVIDAQAQRFGNIPTHAHACGTTQLPTGMESSVRFPTGVSPVETMHRFRGHSPHIMDVISTRMPTPHIGGGGNNMPSNQHYGTVLPCSDHGIPCGPGQPMGGGCFRPENAHSHLHSLQKMTPSFDVNPASKMAVDTIRSGQSGNGQLFGSGAVVPGLHSASPTNNSQRLSHFDPIASMAAMTETTGPITTTANNTRPPNAMMTSMNIANMHVTNAVPNNQPNIVNFHTSMQSMQGMHQEGQPSYNMSNQIGHNMGNGPQTVNNTYVNATMSIQQLNIQNVPTSAYSSNLHIPSMNPNPGMIHQPMNHASVTQTVNSSVAANHPIMHSTVSPKNVSVNMGIGPLRGNPHVQSFTGQTISAQRTMNPMNASMVPGMMTRAPGAVAPFNSTNIHVKANAPNTIQYLPARPQNATPTTNRPPSLDFLQRFATPLTNLDNKVPTHNLQYFPNGSNGTQTLNNVNASLPPTPPSGMAPGQAIIGAQRALNMTVGTMGMRSPAPGPISQGMNQMYQGMMKVGGRESPIFARSGSQPGNIQGGIMGLSGPSSGMFPNKQISPSGSAPDASQPLPPSMGQSFNYKHSPFCGPTTADPNYAVQFHNFQQQLYATNTRNSQNSINPGQGFFTPK